MNEVKYQDEPSWLLRLFESDFFDARLAVSYLYRYPSAGIHHYICRELKTYPESDIEFLLPQIWYSDIGLIALSHIMISRPDESASLEEYTMAICKESNHIAILTLWYLESYLSDMRSSLSRQSEFLLPQSESLLLCKRICHGCKVIVFSETDCTSREITSDLVQFDVHQSAHVAPGIVGIGIVLASMGAPIANVAVNAMVKTRAIQPRFLSNHDVNSDFLAMEGEKSDSLIKIFARIPTTPPSLDELSTGTAFSFHNFIKKTTVPSPTIEQFDGDISMEIEQHQKLQRPHYFHSEMQFIMTLVEISKRLVAVPKDARQSSLLAELTLLNHNLPANICLPFMCPATAKSQHHHQIVRIALSDCVVLNSAERVPYLMVVEVIESTSSAPRKESFPGVDIPSVLSSRRSSQSAPLSPLSPFSQNFSSSLDTSYPRNKLDIDLSNESLSSSKTPRNFFKEPKDYHQQVMTRRQSFSTPEQCEANIEVLLGDSPVRKLQQIEITFSEKIRTAAILLAQLFKKQQMTHKNQSSVVSAPMTSTLDRKSEFEVIRGRVLEEMAAAESERLQQLGGDRIVEGIQQFDESLPEIQERVLQRDDEDPSASVFREPWEDKKTRIRKSSPYGKDNNWQLYSVIVKSGADLRQEQLALQLITEMQRSWDAFRIPIWVYSFRMLVTSDHSGLIEVIPDSVSIHSIKKHGYTSRFNQPGIAFTLYDHFVKEFVGTEKFEDAQDNFVQSLAGYSILSYLLQLKDRHNGNILLDRQGHLTHIDFGFMLMNSPGSLGFELAAFKLTQEYVDVMGGMLSEKFADFRELVKLGFLAIRKRSESLICLVEIMEKDSRLPCFTGVNNKPILTPKNNTPTTALKYPVAQGFRDRLQLGLTDEACGDFLDKLIDSSCNNTFTNLYDMMQYYSQGIL